MILTLLLFIMSLNITHKQVQEKDLYAAIIDAKLERGSLMIECAFENKSTERVDFTYRFKCRRISLSGTSVSSQSGKVKADPGQVVKLNKMAVSLMLSDKYDLKLEVYNGSQLVAEQTMAAPE